MPKASIHEQLVREAVDGFVVVVAEIDEKQKEALEGLFTKFANGELQRFVGLLAGIPPSDAPKAKKK